MGKITDIAKQASPHCAAVYLNGLSQDAYFEKYSITTPLRQTHFLAQVFAETGGGTIIQENMNYSAPRLVEIFGVGKSSAKITESEAAILAHHPEAIGERVYGLGNPYMARMLGNVAHGDGYKWRGVGPLQSTGLGSAIKWGDRIGVNFRPDPLLMVDQKYVMLPPILEWDAGGLNSYADVGEYRHIRKIINGGYNGLADVETWIAKLWPLFKAAHDPVEQWAAAALDGRTQTLQLGLNQIGYTPKLNSDGLYGPGTKKAVEWFQQISGLKVDGIAGAMTRAMLQSRLSSRPVGMVEAV